MDCTKLPQSIDPETSGYILEFLNDISSNGCTEVTIEGYYIVLRLVFSTIGKSLKELTTDDVLNWLQKNYDNKKPRTYRHKLSVLKSFFRHCLKNGYITKMPVKRWWAPRIGKPIPKYLNHTELVRVKMRAEELKIKNRCMAEILLSTGIRVSELCNIDIKDVDLDKCSIKIMGKGRKERFVEFSKEALILLEKHLAAHPKNQQALFLSNYRKRICAGQVRYIVRKLGKDAEMVRSLTPHVFRHTYATICLQKG